MAFGVVFRSNLAFTFRAHNEINKQALFAAANVVRTAAIKRARKGMTSGKYVTPHLAKNIFKEVHLGNSVVKTENRIALQGNSPIRVNKGVAYIGTPVKHGAYWEFGHDNIFIGRSVGSATGSVYVKEPWLTLAFTETISKQQKAASKAADRAARRFGKMGLERLVGLTPIGSLRSTIG